VTEMIRIAILDDYQNAALVSVTVRQGATFSV
jgi:hypothetical protein